MKLKNSLILITCFSLFSVFILCSKIEKSKQKVVILDSDTITMEKLSAFSPDTNFTTEKIRKLSLAALVAKQPLQKHGIKVSKEIVNDLADQLSRETGLNWNYESTEQIYLASKIIQKKLEASADTHTLHSFLDSVTKKIRIPSDKNLSYLIFDTISDYSSVSEKKKQLASILFSLFCSDIYSATIISEFLYSENLVTDESKDIDKLVKGLVHDNSVKKQKPVYVKKNKPVRKDNSSLALKFRDQQSIRNTINKHIPNLKALYKKQLKINTNMSGVVYVTFRVNPSGKVIYAKIKTTEINNKEFIFPFLDYVKSINFKTIPEHVGNMTFDFPFEFSPKQ